MCAELLLAVAFQIGPFYEQRPDYYAFRPFYAREAETTDVVWPVFTAHRDWWRFAFFTHYQETAAGGHQFEIIPIWFNGRTEAEAEPYWGFFPFYGYHPHFLLMHDFEFALWPIWMRYRMPRPQAQRYLTSNVVLFPFFHWRDDGSWGFWPVYGVSHNRSDDHRYLLWPILNWQTAYVDRDTAGKGTSWMFWPFYASVDREREQQWQILPPLFSRAETPQGWQGRFPWPLVEIERFRHRSRTSIFPFYEHIENYTFLDETPSTEITRFGWRLVEILPEETRVFPFYVHGEDYLRCWPFWESSTEGGLTYSCALSLFPIRWVPSVDRNWSKFWTFYEAVDNSVYTEHSLLWGIIRWRTYNND